MIAYDEEDNGFLFKRTRSKQLQTKNAIETEPFPPSTISSEPAPAKRRRKTFLSPDVSNARATQQPRRSKRLSGDKAPDPSTPAQLKIKRRETIVPPKQAEKASESPRLIDEYLPVDRTREGTKIALPFADTPVQNRNKQMREKAANKQKSRRSSSGIRGRRASSLLDSGTSNGQLHIYGVETNTGVRQFHASISIPLQESEHLICQISLSSNTNASLNNFENEFEADELNHAALPHTDVDTKDFYKHIDPTLPEPHRMRHLLTWCGARALPEKVPGGNRDPNEALAVDAGKLIKSNIYFVFDS